MPIKSQQLGQDASLLRQANPCADEQEVSGPETEGSESERLATEGRNPAIAYYPGLDGLRGVAIGLVLWYHALFLFPDAADVAMKGAAGRFWYMAFSGWMGVDLFFVISGFLITSILLRTCRQPGGLRQFWIRRALRILPLAYIYLGFLWVTQAFGDPFQIDLSGWDYLAYAFYFGNVHISMQGWQPLALMVLWSLAVEEQFYLFWPFLVRHFDAQKVLSACVGLLVLSPVVRILVEQWIGHPATYVFTLCRLDTMAVGSALAIVWSIPAWRTSVEKIAKRWLWLAVVFLSFVIWNGYGPSHEVGHPLWFTVFGYSAISLAFAVVLVRTLDEESLLCRWMLNSALSRVGKLCYGIYLWHSVVGMSLYQIGKASSWQPRLELYMFAWLCLTFLTAAASWRWLERPVLKWKQHFQPTLSPAA